MKDVVFQTYLVILSVLLPILLGWMIKLLKSQRNDRKANSTGTMLLLRVQLIEYHDKWTERGYVTKVGLQNFIEMYECYHNLGGNGMITDLKKQVEDLPIRG